MAADVVAGEIARLDGRLPDLDDKQRAEITQTVRRVVDKLLHAPTVRVKQLAGEPGGAGYADALRELFDLDPQAVAAVSRAELTDPSSTDAKNRGPGMTEHATATTGDPARASSPWPSPGRIAERGAPASRDAPVELVEITTYGDVSARAAGADRRHRRVRHRAARRAAERARSTSPCTP